MKKIFTKLMIISIVGAIIILFLCYFSFVSSKLPESSTKQIVNEVKDNNTDTPSSGEYLLIAGGVSILKDFGTALAYMIFILLIPGFILFLVIILQFIARILQIGVQKNWKDIISKVFTYISIGLQIFLSLELIFTMITDLNFNKLFIFISLIINITCIVLFVKELNNIEKSNINAIKEEN